MNKTIKHKDKRSRLYKAQRLRYRSITKNQTRIPQFCRILNDIDLILQKNKELKICLENALLIREENSEENVRKNYDEKNTFLLQILINSAKKNVNMSNRMSNPGSRYNKTLKLFSTYIFMLGGRLLYETLYKNLPLPSPTSISRYLQKNGQKMVEGELRCDQLKSYLYERNLPSTVWISEDATRITGKIQYDPSTNQLVGLVLPLNEHGMPISYSFMARSAKEIEHYFSEGKTASLVYAIMAQPIAEHSGPFCLSLFGTDNRFTSQEVTKRWKFILKELATFGITVLGFSSDGDPRLLKAMRTETRLGISQMCSALHSKLTSNWPWFIAIYTDNGFVQDIIHIATKLRNRLLKPSILLPFGNKLISVSHLKILINIVSKDKHLLSLSDIEPKDKMNFESANKISQEYVRKLLLNHIPDSESTVLYLKLLNYIILSYTDPYLVPLERLFKLWYCVFIIRIWRNWIKGNRKYTLTDNFLSLNCYACIEINAHSMVNIIQKLRDCNMPHLFMPPLFSSQPCEAFFRQIRSMSTTYSTIVNCSLLDVIHRIKKIQLQSDILASELNKNINFSRMEHKVKTIQIQSNLPTNDDIYEAIEEAKKKQSLILTSLV